MPNLNFETLAILLITYRSHHATKWPIIMIITSNMSMTDHNMVQLANLPHFTVFSGSVV